MKTNILGLGLIFILGLAACANQKKATAKAEPKSEPTIKMASATTQDAGATASLSDAMAKEEGQKVGNLNYIKMSKGGCYGKCPSYVVEIQKDGLVRFVSERFTKYEGTYEKNIGAGKALEIFREFNHYRVDTCKDSYQNHIPDLSPISFNLIYDKKKKEIQNAHFGPEFFNALIGMVDAIAQVDETWKKTAEPNKRQ